MTYAELFAFASEHGLELNPDLEAKFHRYAELLAAWNEKMNLTSITEESEVIEKHFLDSLTPVFTTSFAGKSVADMGSGAGFPGMVFATAFPSCHVTLMDATKKKFLFLEELKKELELSNVRFYVGRVEEAKTMRESFDIVTARGFAAARILLEVGAPLVKVNGTVIAMKGPRGEEELHEALGIEQRLALHLRKKEELVMPSGEKRINYFFEKIHPTKPCYPRSWADIQKKPL